MGHISKRGRHEYSLRSKAMKRVGREKGLAIPEWWPTGSTRANRGRGWEEQRGTRGSLPLKPRITHYTLKSRGNIGRASDSALPCSMSVMDQPLAILSNQNSGKHVRTNSGMLDQSDTRFLIAESEIQKEYLILLWPCHRSYYKDIRPGIPT